MGQEPRKTYFEFRPIGAQVKVSALDSVTGIEVSIIAPATATKINMQKIAQQKLQRAMERKLKTA